MSKMMNENFRHDPLWKVEKSTSKIRDWYLQGRIPRKVEVSKLSGKALRISGTAIFFKRSPSMTRLCMILLYLWRRVYWHLWRRVCRVLTYFKVLKHGMLEVMRPDILAQTNFPPRNFQETSSPVRKIGALKIAHSTWSSLTCMRGRTVSSLWMRRGHHLVVPSTLILSRSQMSKKMT
jgi:hypothetical protein